MHEVRDFGIAVADAIRLNDCFHALFDAFSSRPAIDGEESLLLKNLLIFPSTPESKEWEHRVNSEEVAEHYIRAAIINRDFPLWIRTATADEKVDPYAIVTIEHRTIRTGKYRPRNDPMSYLVDRPLWVKEADWRPFFDRAMSDRYGAPLATKAPSVMAPRYPTDKEIIAMIRTVHAEGFKGREIAKAVRSKPGFGQAKHQTIRALSDGLFPRTGRGRGKE